MASTNARSSARAMAPARPPTVRGSGRGDNGELMSTMSMVSEASGVGGQLVYSRDIYRNTIHKFRVLLNWGAVFTIIFAIVQFVGSALAYSLCLLVNSTAYLIIFARILFLGFVFEHAGRSTGRLATFRRHKPELHLVYAAMLFAWLILGGALFNACSHWVHDDYGVSDPLLFLIFSALNVLFSIVILNVLLLGRRFVGGGAPPPTNDSELPLEADAPEGSLHAALALYARERGAALKRTLRRVPTKPYNMIAIVFVLQSVVALLAALAFWFWPDDTRQVDLILAFVFTPLAVISTNILMKNIIDALTHGGMLQGITVNDVKRRLKGIKGVADAREIEIIALSMDQVQISAMLVVGHDVSVGDVLNEASALLKMKFECFEYRLGADRLPRDRRSIN